MEKTINVPYFKQPDNSHCFQACLKMTLKYFFPEKDFTWEELDKMSNKPKDKWTWICAAFVKLKKMGLKVKVCGNLDYYEFSKRGADYIREFFSKEVAERNIEMSDIGAAAEDAKKMVKEGIYEKADIKFEDIENWFKDGYFIITSINSMVLNNKEGYSGHAVVLTGLDDDYVFIHDPGMIYGSANRKVKKDTFLKALFYSGKNKEVCLIKK